MKYEFIKMTRKMGFRIILLITLVLSIVSPILSVKNYYTINNKKEVYGLEGIKIEKDRYEKIGGYLTLDVLNNTLKIFKTENVEAGIIKSEALYPGVFSLLATAYSPIRQYDISNLNKIETADNFYEMRISMVEDFLNLDYESKMFDDWEKAFIIDRANNTETPFRYGYYDGWTSLFKNLQYIMLGNILIAIIMSSQIFTIEKESNMLSILNSNGKNKISKIYKNKILAAYTLGAFIYFVTVLITSSIILASFGANGNFNIQISRRYFLSIHNLTFLKSYLIYLAIGLICIISTISLSAIINSKCKKSFTSLILGTGMVFIPLLLSKINYLPLTLRKIFSLFPIQGIFLEDNLISQQIYSFGVIKLDRLNGIVLLNLLIIGACILIFKGRKTRLS